MAETKYGLSREGFRRKRLPDILRSLHARVSDKLGIPIETGANSLLGQLHGVYAYEIADLWENAEDVYNAMYPHTASGVSLSNAAALAGIAQITAEKSALIATCCGKDGTRIPYGAQISSGSSADLLFSCRETDALISSNHASYAEIEMAAIPAAGTPYAVTIDGKKVAYTARAQDGKAVVLTALAGLLKEDGRVVRMENDVLFLRLKNEQLTMSIALDNLSFRRVGSPVRFVCDKEGSIDPPLGTVTNIVTSVAGWAAVSNNVPTVVGRADETDTELRQRWSSSVHQRSSAMTESIKAALYRVTGVTAVRVYENTSDAVDSAGRPPHSVEVVAVGGDVADVAATVWQFKAGGIDTFGAISQRVYDSDGFPHVIKFNRPIPVKVWLKASIGENPDEELPNAALFEIGEALLQKGQQQEIGQDVILQRYFAEIFKATRGVGYIELLAATGDSPGTYAKTNIIIDDRHVAMFDLSRIEVKKL